MGAQLRALVRRTLAASRRGGSGCAALLIPLATACDVFITIILFLSTCLVYPHASRPTGHHLPPAHTQCPNKWVIGWGMDTAQIYRRCAAACALTPHGGACQFQLVQQGLDRSNICGIMTSQAGMHPQGAPCWLAHELPAPANAALQMLLSSHTCRPPRSLPYIGVMKKEAQERFLSGIK